MRSLRAGIGRLRHDEAVGHEELTFVTRPEAVVRQFVSEDGLHLHGVQQGGQRPAEHHVGFPRQVEQRGVQAVELRGLIECDGHVQVQARAGLLRLGVEFGMRVGIEPVSGLEQIAAQGLRVCGLRLRRGKPPPQLRLACLEVRDDFPMVRQRVKHGLAGGAGVHSALSRCRPRYSWSKT